MGQRLITIATYATPEEASVVQQNLKANGVTAFLDQAGLVGNFWYFGNATGGVKLQVPEDEVPKAREILAEIMETDPDAAPWDCQQCGKHNEASFDACWSCGASRAGEPDPHFSPVEGENAEDDSPVDVPFHDSHEARELPAVQITPRPSQNPYVSPEFTDSPQNDEEQEDSADPGDVVAIRAFRAAVIGVIVCPPALTLYSMYLLIRLTIERSQLSTKGNRCFFWACIFDLGAVALALFYVRMIIR